MAKNLAMSAAIGVLLAALVVTVVNSKNDKSWASSASSGGRIHTSIKSLDSIEALCDDTDYVDACKRLLGRVSTTSNTTKLITEAGEAAMEEINRLIGRTDEIGKAVSDPNNKRALDSCRNFISYAIDDLREVIMEAGNIKTKSFELRNWMSMVIANANTCVDELDVTPDLRDQMHNYMGNASELMSNALTLITALAGVHKDVEGIDIGMGRALGEDGYPHWMSATERKLLATGGVSNKPDITVALDGSGDVKSITEAIKKVPPKSPNRFIIYVKAGEYKEQVIVPKEAQNIFMYGDGPRKTKVINSAHWPLNTADTATFAVLGLGFVCKAMCFSNPSGPSGKQAVALFVNSDRSAFFNCRMEGFQDTLCTNNGLQFYSNCVIAGTVDFIFGSGTTLIQNSQIFVRRPADGQYNAVTADGRTEELQTTGIVIQNCKILADKSLMNDRLAIRSYLGRPWKKHSRAIIMESVIGDLIRPEGWVEWEEKDFEKHCFFREYNNEGPGASLNDRVSWSKKTPFGRNEAQQFTIEKFLAGSTWILAIGAKVTPGFHKA